MTVAPSVVLLDVDGTLVDSNRLHARAWSEAFAEVDIDLPPEAVLPYIGMAADNLIPQLTRLAPGEPLARQVSERAGALFLQRHLAAVRPFPHARDLLLRMRAAGQRLVIASSSSGEKLRRLLEIAGAADLVDGVPDAEEVDTSKPAPDVVEAALEVADTDPARAMMLGDTPWDVGAATRAGVRIVAVRSGGWDAEALQGATAVYQDVADLYARFEGSPFAPRP